MQIDSVRALKEEIASELLEPIVEQALIRRTFGIEAMSLRRSRGPTRAVALGIARSRDGDFNLAVRIQRRALDEGSGLVQLIAERARGELDVRYVGQIVKQAPWHRARQRPLLIGCSVAHYNVTAGTIGAVAVAANGQRVILSNNHVLANEDRCRAGDPVLQPGPYDGGVPPTDIAAHLSRWIKLRSTGNLVDAAIADLTNGMSFDPLALDGLGRFAGLSPTPVQPGDQVAKIGRTTGLTYGTVTAVELDAVVVGYDRGALSFDQQIEIEGNGSGAFSAGGDSGSVILDQANRAVGLLFAGGDQGGRNGKGLTYANDIGNVVSALGIEFVA